MWQEFVERMVLGDHLGEWSEREPTSVVEHASGKVGRSMKGEPVVRECRGRPHLSS